MKILASRTQTLLIAAQERRSHGSGVSEIDGWTTSGKLSKLYTNMSSIQLPKFGRLTRFFWPEILPATESTTFAGRS
jgi:hypothetical protein